MKPLISIGMPVYNAERTLRHAKRTSIVRLMPLGRRGLPRSVYEKTLVEILVCSPVLNL